MDFTLLKKNAAYRNLRRDIDSGALSHAYLVLSEDGEARKAFFLLSALSVYCPSLCGTCGNCRKILSGNHVDIQFLDGNNKLKVADIVKLTENAMLNPVLGERKLFFIDNADKLSAQAQNKLLKTYEEPPSYVTIFLGTGNESALLSTVKSRGKRLAITPFPTEDIHALLLDDGINEAVAESAAAYSMGNYEKAVRFASDEGYQTVYSDSFLLLLTLKNSSRIAEFLYTEMFSKERIAMSLDFIELILSDVAKLASGSDAPRFTVGREYDLREIAKEYTAPSAAMAIIAVQTARKKLNFNVNAVSVAEGVLFDILEAKYRWRQ